MIQKPSEGKHPHIIKICNSIFYDGDHDLLQGVGNTLPMTLYPLLWSFENYATIQILMVSYSFRNNINYINLNPKNQ